AGSLALGEEDVALRLRFIAHHELAEQRLLARKPVIERQREGVAHGFDARGLRPPPARASDDLRRRFLVSGGVGARRRGLVLTVAPELDRLADRVAREIDRSRDELTVEHRVDNAERERAVGRNHVAGHDRLEALLRPDQPRQALRAAGARQNAELDLGKTDAGAAVRDAIVAGERKLETAAERPTRGAAGARV